MLNFVPHKTLSLALGLHKLCAQNIQSPTKVLGTPCDKSPFLSHLPSHHVKHPPLPPKQCCFTEKYLCGLKTTLIRGGGGGKDDFQKNQSIKPYKGESVPTLLSEIVGIRVSLFHHILGYTSWWNVFRLVLLTTAISKTGWFPSYKWMGPDWGRFFNCMRGWGRWKIVKRTAVV